MALKRLKVEIKGAVQGVGFRPFVYRKAKEIGLKGYVVNSSRGVYIEVEGEEKSLYRFLNSIRDEKPPRAFIQSFIYTLLEPIGYGDFEIRESREEGEKIVLILPDIATCEECKKETLNPNERRYRYPFTNCTNCGPRFTIIESLPYDRPNTSMKIFEMCENCRREYENPVDRRFHAQPIACPVCGPNIYLTDREGRLLLSGDEALREVEKLIKNGKILAIKGLGGFHIVVDARNEEAIGRLRERKPRRDKPFALMFPSIEDVEKECFINDEEKRLLASPESPIVLLKRKPESRLPDIIAPNNPYLGVMLPYTPLHLLLLKDLAFPIIATSGNLTDEPIIIDEEEALLKLQNVVDYFLFHSRPIVRHVDDSITRVADFGLQILRRARGYVPLPIEIKLELPKVLAMGPHLKNTFAMLIGKNVIISQHMGDLDSMEGLKVYRKNIKDFMELWEFKPDAVVVDMHPDYLSTREGEKLAGDFEVPLYRVQHHHAHIVSCMVENEVEGEVLGVAFDGTGYGEDGNVWGGEFLISSYEGYRRFAHLRYFPLPGGDRAIKEPRKVALGVLIEIYKEKIFEIDHPLIKSFKEEELKTYIEMYRKKLGMPLTSSMGRLFDAVSALLGIRYTITFEAQAAMDLEFEAMKDETEERYSFQIRSSQENYIIDWEPMIKEILEDKSKREKKARRFHNTIVKMIIDILELSPVNRVALSGGVFQNLLLSNLVHRELKRMGVTHYLHRRIPPNDGGISLGQAVVGGVLHGRIQR